MTMFVSDNPVLMSGSIVARRGEKVVLGDGRGRTLTFEWSDRNDSRVRGTPSDVIVDLPLAENGTRAAHCLPLHVEGNPVQVRYVAEPANHDLVVISYTLCEDMRELFIESEAPALAHKDPSESIRIGMGPDG